MAAFAEINPVPADRLKEIMKENMNDKGKSIKAVDLHKMTGISAKHLSNILTLNKPLTEGTAQKIIKAFPWRNYRIAWLLGYDDYKTEGAKFHAELEEYQEEVRQGNENQKKIRKAVATLMGIYGIEWNGEPTSIHYKVKGNMRKRLPDEPAATYRNADFYSWELAFIADKIFEEVGRELNFAVKMKQAHDDETKQDRETATSYGH